MRPSKAKQNFKVSPEAADALTSMEPGSAVVTALQMLLDRDADMLLADVNERAITHRFAMYLQDQLRDWQVDCELQS